MLDPSVTAEAWPPTAVVITNGNHFARIILEPVVEHEPPQDWLARARAFAMHAAEQVEAARTEYGRGRYSLWTGDLGTALYLSDCSDGAGKLPLP